MNAKKIMGAVLVAFLAAALFIGAGAAAGPGEGETVFVFQPVSGYNGIWSNGANTVTFEPVGNTGSVVIKGADIVEGQYTQGEKSIIVKYPTAVISGVAGEFPNQYTFIGGNLYDEDDFVITNATGVTDVPAEGYLLTSGNGVEQKYTTLPTTLDVGTYKIQVYFNASDFVAGTPANYLLGQVYTFNVVEADDAEITAEADTVVAGDIVKLTITAKPGSTFTLGNDDFEIVADQMNVDENDEVITVPNTGKVTIAVKALSSAKDVETIVLLTTDNSVEDPNVAEVDITIEEPTITAVLGASSYFIGDEIKITGTATAELEFEKFTITGTNFKETELEYEDDEFGKNWEVTLLTKDVTELDEDDGKKLDVGTYTIKIYVDEEDEKPVKTITVALKQPFVSIIEAPEVITQKSEAEFVINAEAASTIKVYIFGTNYFLEVPAEQISKDKDLKNKFTAKLTEDNTAVANMSTGQYFMVIQHPMYDGDFNIAAVDQTFYLNTSGDATDDDQFLFNVNDRQTANAAQALCDALDSQNIDDMYVKYSFFVIGEDDSFVINDIPKEVTKGTTFTVSGVDTANAGKEVAVEMISTAFAALPKETVGSAAFILVTTTVADDGTWEVTLDTSDLNVDEYSLSVAIDSAQKKNVNINVVEAADEPVTPPTDEPGQDEPGQDEPVAPETPGFGALAALAGLGAVAVLLLRRE